MGTLCNAVDEDGRSPIWRGEQPQGENRKCNRPDRPFRCAQNEEVGSARRLRTYDEATLSARRARLGTVHTSARLVVTMKVRSRKGISIMDYGAWFLFTLRMEAKSQQGGLYVLMQSVPPTATNKKRSSTPVSHKTLCRPLLPSGPGGVEQRLVAQDLTSRLEENTNEMLRKC